MLSGFLNAVTLFAGADSAFAGSLSASADSNHSTIDEYPNQVSVQTQKETIYIYKFDSTQENDSQIEVKTTSSGLLADEIEIEPKVPVNPAGKPGVGGLAGIPAAIGAIIGADGFCSIYNFPSAGLCVGDPAVPMEERDEKTGHGAMPSWCLINPDWAYCPNVETDLNENTGLNWDVEYCFDLDWNKVPCDFTDANNALCMPVKDYKGSIDTYGSPGFISCNSVVQCYSQNDIPVNCNIANSLNKNISSYYNGKYSNSPYVMGGKCLNQVPIQSDGKKYVETKCYIPGYNVLHSDEPFSSGYKIDRYLRIMDSNTSLPVTNEFFEGGYPKNAVYPPEPEPEPEPPFNPGSNPFNPTLPEIPETEECSGIICECIALVTNALGAVNNTLLKIDESVLSIVESIESGVLQLEGAFSGTLDLQPMIDKLNEILEAVDSISVEVVKEAGTNFWDVLGGAFGDIFDLIEFLIDKVIYLVVPEDTANINTAFENLNSLISNKMQPVDQVKTAINDSVNVEKQNFEDIYITLPQFGRVKFFESEYLLIAVPWIQRLMSAFMILTTAIWAYRKVSSEMIK